MLTITTSKTHYPEAGPHTRDYETSETFEYPDTEPLRIAG